MKKQKIKKAKNESYLKTVTRWVWLLAIVLFFLFVLAKVVEGVSYPVEAMSLVPAKTVAQTTEQPAAVNHGKTIRATVTTYQAVAGQTDSSPCVGAMPRVNFCNPPFPIVANNALPLGTKVQIDGVTYVVADRMNSRYGANHFDVLTDGTNYKLTTDVIIL